MNREHTIAILGILKTAYPRFYANMKKQEAEDTIALWQEMFNDTDPMIVTIAVKSLIAHLEFPPTIADVKKEISKMNDSDKTIDYWNEAYKMICNGLYMTDEEFKSHSRVVQRYFGSVNRLKEKSMTENLNFEVEQSNFNKVVDVLLQEQKEYTMLPGNVREQINALASKMDAVKMLGGNI